MKTSMLCLLFLSGALNANTLPQMTKLGEGEMSYLFWSLYRAELYVNELPYQHHVYPKLLKIEYFKSIKKDDLLNATKEQWQHIGIDDNSITDWLVQLQDIWPDIDEGDQLIIYVNGEGQSIFYSDISDLSTNELGVINDVHFGPAFLDIWLSEKTSEPELRAKLLGGVQ
jgi:hypothetical protein